MADDKTRNTDILLCIAIDVSGSMKESIGQQSTPSSTRYEAVQRSLNKLATEARSKILDRRSQGYPVRFDLFAYAFGLNAESHCDLLTLLKLSKFVLANQMSTPALPSANADPYDDIISILKHCGVNDLHRYRQWAGEVLNAGEAERLCARMRQYPNIASILADMLPKTFSEVEERVGKKAKAGALVGGVLSAVAATVLTGGLAAVFMAAAAGAAAGTAKGKSDGIAAERKRLAKPEALAHELAAADDSGVIRIIVREGGHGALKRLANAGETTISIGDLETLLDERVSPLDSMESLLYGNTPMVTALGAIRQRFAREVMTRPGAKQILFLLSDGQPTDGDPSAIAETLKKDGVHIVSCYIANEDIDCPRVLYDAAQPPWSKSAKLMFTMASEIDSLSAFPGFFREFGWTVSQGARSFVQVNHPQILDEFIRVVLSPLNEAYQ